MTASVPFELGHQNFYPLRKDIHVLEAHKGKNGTLTWTLQDPVQQRFYRISQKDVEILSCLPSFGAYTSDKIWERVKRKFGASYTIDDVENLLSFLQRMNLLILAGAENKQKLWQDYKASKGFTWKKIAQSYLSVKIPLTRPDDLLATLKPIADVTVKKRFWIIIGIIWALGLFLALRQSDQFFTTFANVLTVQGMAYFFPMLIGTKILHEFGHALTAKRYGCHIPVMGVAFLIFWPVLYVDTTDAWKLKSPKQRAMIDAAGVLTEFIIGGFFLLLWSFLPEGPLKGACFLLTLFNLVSTLLVNANPLLKFDGYFFMSDILDMPNLHERVFALTKWRLRKLLWGFNHSPPEKPKKWIYAFAVSVWTYRFFLFIAIAAIIYSYFFKALGAALMSYQLWQMVIKPMKSEIKIWYDHRKQINWSGRGYYTVAAFIMLCLLLVIPWRSTVTMPAYLTVNDRQEIYAPHDGYVISLTKTDKAVNKGELLFDLVSPELENKLSLAKLELKTAQIGLNLSSLDTEKKSELLKATADVVTARQKLKSLTVEYDRTKIIASLGGRIVDINSFVKKNGWIEKDQYIARVITEKQSKVIAYVSDLDRNRLSVGGQAEFISTGSQNITLPLTIERIEHVPVYSLQKGYVAAAFNGGLDVLQREDNSLKPVRTVFRVHLSAKSAAPIRVTTGQVNIATSSESFIYSVYKRALALWRRESGF